MSDDFSYLAPRSRSDDETDIFGWLRWWHWLILLGLFLFGLVYYPLWRFDQRWKRVQMGDSLEQVKALLGDPGDAAYTVQGIGPQGSYQTYAFRVYWRTYEVLIANDTHRVIGKTVNGAPAGPPGIPPRNGGPAPVTDP
jgi:hypothetical protein